MQILRESFEEAYGKLADDLAREHYTDTTDDMNQYMMMFQTEFSDLIDLEDELANVERVEFIKTGNGKLMISGQLIEFKTKNSKTIKPYIGNTELKGPLKKKFLATLGFGHDTETVEMWGKYFTKQKFQYGNIALAYFMSDWKMNKGFFMRVKTSKINRTTRKPVYTGDRFAYAEERNTEMEILQEQLSVLQERVLELEEEVESHYDY